MLARLIALVVAVVVSGCGGAQRAETAASNGRYPVPAQVGTVVTDAAAFAAFARAVRPDLERDATSKDPEIAKSRLFVLAMLDALDDKWAPAVEKLDRVTALETAPATKAITGLTLRAWSDAISRGGDANAFRTAFEARVAVLPMAELGEELSMLRTMGQAFTPELCAKLVDEEVGPKVESGTVSIDEAHAIVFQRYAVVRLVPVGKMIDQVLGAQNIEPIRD